MIASMYQQYARKYEQAISNNIYNALLERPSLLSMLPCLEGKAVLDLGCGPGIYAEQLLTMGARVTACDASADMIDIVATKFGHHVPCYTQDLRSGLPRENDNSYDVVICPLTIHYIEDVTTLFSDIYRVLKPEGLFFFSTHHPLVDFEASPTGNYFLREKVIEEWDTVGHPVQVQFYRRSLSELFNSVTTSGLVVHKLSEGKPAIEMKERYPEAYERLSSKPHFIFFECQKPSHAQLKTLV